MHAIVRASTQKSQEANEQSDLPTDFVNWLISKFGAKSTQERLQKAALKSSLRSQL